MVLLYTEGEARTGGVGLGYPMPAGGKKEWIEGVPSVL